MLKYIRLLLVSLVSRTQGRTLTLGEVADHDSSSDCWSGLYGKVYDLTAYGSRHPNRGGGATVVWSLCGIDGTSLYDDVHGGSERAYLDSFSSIEFIGELGTDPLPTDPPSPTNPPATDPPQTDPPIEAPTPTDPLATDPPKTTTTPTNFPQTDPPTEAPTPTDPPATDPPSATQEPSTPQSDGPTGKISLDELEMHNSHDDCWVLFYEYVYDMTEYAYQHPPPGAAVIHTFCGKNGTDAYGFQHSKDLLFLVEEFLIGKVEETRTTKPSIEAKDIFVSLEELAEHDTPEDCWVAFFEVVYDMTTYSYSHPGPGAAAIHPFCGDDGTEGIRPFHKPDLLTRVDSEIVGELYSSARIMGFSFAAISSSALALLAAL
jgi:cytochrome b involved in lipid metabolism